MEFLSWDFLISKMSSIKKFPNLKTSLTNLEILDFIKVKIRKDPFLIFLFFKIMF